jgi:hypothetical protein
VLKLLLFYMVPKLRVTIREAMLRARTDSRATASGYHHTHFDARGLEIPVLTTFPNDDEIAAAGEAESLLALLGVSPTRLQENATVTPTRLQANATVTLPPITALHVDEDGYAAGDMVSEAQQLQDMINDGEGGDNYEELLQLVQATTLVTADDFMRMIVTHV